MLPEEWQARVEPWLGRRVILNTPALRRRIEDNLARVFPDKGFGDRQRLLAEIAGKSAQNMIALLDNGRLIAEAKTRIDFPDTAETRALFEARAAGRPILIIGGHYGMFDAGRIGLKAHGIEVGALYRPQNDPLFNRFLVDRLSRAGRPMFPRGRAGLRDMLKHLRGGGAAAILIDQKTGMGEPLEFLGHPAMTSTDAATLAVKLDALVMSGNVIRTGPGRYRLDFVGPVPHDDPIPMTQAMNDILAAQIRKDPTEWHWLHRRWSSPQHQFDRAAGTPPPSRGAG